MEPDAPFVTGLLLLYCTFYFELCETQGDNVFVTGMVTSCCGEILPGGAK